MGLASIDPHSQKEHTKIHKILKFGVNQASFDRYSHLKTSKFKRNVRPSGRCVRTASGWPYIFFVNFDIFKWQYLAYYWVYLHQTWGFCKAWSGLYDYVDQ